MYKSTRKKVEGIMTLVKQWYEPGRQDRCKLWVYRNKVRPEFGISERTFFRYLGATIEEEVDEQPTLFDVSEFSV